MQRPPHSHAALQLLRLTQRRSVEQEGLEPEGACQPLPQVLGQQVRGEGVGCGVVQCEGGRGVSESRASSCRARGEAHGPEE